MVSTGFPNVAALAVESQTPALLNITTSGLGAGLPASVPVAFDRKAQAFRSVKALVEDFRNAPDRRKGTATVDTLDSFISLVNRHKDERSALFGRCVWPDPKLTAVIDYDDAAGEARNRQHRIVYAFPLTEEFKTWVEMNAKPMPQDVFASPAFHIGVAVTIGAVVLAVRRLAHEAFRDALASRHARLAGHRQRTVALSAQCPRRALVLLHVQLNRQPFDPAPFDPAAFDPALY